MPKKILKFFYFSNLSLFWKKKFEKFSKISQKFLVQTTEFGRLNALKIILGQKNLKWRNLKKKIFWKKVSEFLMQWKLLDSICSAFLGSLKILKMPEKCFPSNFWVKMMKKIFQKFWLHIPKFGRLNHFWPIWGHITIVWALLSLFEFFFGVKTQNRFSELK